MSALEKYREDRYYHQLGSGDTFKIVIEPVANGDGVDTVRLIEIRDSSGTSVVLDYKKMVLLFDLLKKYVL